MERRRANLQIWEFSQVAHTPGHLGKPLDTFLDDPQALCEFFQQGEMCEITEFLPHYSTGWSQEMGKFGFGIQIFFFIPLLTILNHQNDLKLLFLGLQILDLNFNILHHQINQNLTLCLKALFDRIWNTFFHWKQILVYLKSAHIL